MNNHDVANSTMNSPQDISSKTNSSRLAKFNEQAALLGLFFVVMFFTYSSAIFLVYGLNDDYGLMDQAICWPAGSIYQGMAVQGRIIFGAVVQWFFTHIHNLHRLWELRAISIAGLAICAWLLHWVMKRNGWSVWTAACVGIVACTLPPEQVFASWATFVPVPWAIACAIGSGLLAGWIFDGPQSNEAPHIHVGLRWLLAPIAVGLLWITSITYQPSTMVLIPMMVASAYSPRNRDEHVKRMFWRLGFFLAIFFAALAGGFAVFKWGMKKYPDLDVAGRTGLGFNIHSTPLNFAGNTLPRAMNLWVMPTDPWIAWGIGIFILIGLMIYFRGSLGERALRMGICVVCLPLSYLVNLLAEYAFAYRTLIAMDWTILILGIFALVGYGKLFARVGSVEFRETLTRWILVAGTICAAGYAGYWSTMELSWPRAVELADLRLQLSNPKAQGVRHFIVLTMQNWSDYPAPCWTSDEFGCPSIANEMDWESQCAIFMVQREKDAHLTVNPTVEIVKQDQGEPPVAPGPRVFVVDMRRLGGTR